MTKQERLEYMRKRFPILEESRIDAVVPVTKDDIKDEVGLMDTYREFARDKASVKEALTSDEG